MPQKRAIVHFKSWSFLELTRGATLNNQPLLYNFRFAASPYTLQAPVNFIDTDLIQTPRCYVTTLEDNYLLKKLELEEILNLQAAIH
ncbi:MAG: hypothetical protein V7L22_14845 [Nostoc sp.]|uniref:hypothetical protein n=1 Tax=Nostoc sp. TaxID=1180 RepID=UPI002FF9AAD1